MDDESVIPPDEEIKKRLFNSPSPKKTARQDGENDRGTHSSRRAGGRRRSKKPKKAGFRMSLLAVMLFLLLCAAALIITLQPNDSWRKISWKKAQEGEYMYEAICTGHLVFGARVFCALMRA